MSEHIAVFTIQDFKKKYGYTSASLLVKKFITLAPDFDGGRELAGLLGEMCADLETALRSLDGKPQSFNDTFWFRDKDGNVTG